MGWKSLRAQGKPGCMWSPTAMCCRRRGSSAGWATCSLTPGNRSGAEEGSMSLSVSAWHRRYQQQAGWTFTIRQSLFARAGLENARRVLDVGCGTGVLSAEVAGKAQAVYGLDLALEPLQFARHAAPGPAYTRGDAHWLPYRNDCFDIVFCHFLLLWVADPVRAAAEMKRVTRPGGSVLLLAEPDY